MSNAKILIIKTGLIETLTFPDGSSYESAIRKKPVPMVNIHTMGAEGNDVGLKAHHGGVDKALFFMSDVSFPALTKPDKSPFTSTKKTGTPSSLNASAILRSVTVLPVPVAPAIRP